MLFERRSPLQVIVEEMRQDNSEMQRAFEIVGEKAGFGPQEFEWFEASVLRENPELTDRQIRIAQAYRPAHQYAKAVRRQRRAERFLGRVAKIGMLAFGIGAAVAVNSDDASFGIYTMLSGVSAAGVAATGYYLLRR